MIGPDDPTLADRVHLRTLVEHQTFRISKLSSLGSAQPEQSRPNCSEKKQGISGRLRHRLDLKNSPIAINASILGGPIKSRVSDGDVRSTAWAAPSTSERVECLVTGSVGSNAKNCAARIAVVSRSEDGRTGNRQACWIHAGRGRVGKSKDLGIAAAINPHLKNSPIAINASILGGPIKSRSNDGDVRSTAWATISTSERVECLVTGSVIANAENCAARIAVVSRSEDGRTGNRQACWIHAGRGRVGKSKDLGIAAAINPHLKNSPIAINASILGGPIKSRSNDGDVRSTAWATISTSERVECLVTGSVIANAENCAARIAVVSRSEDGRTGNG